VALWLRLPAGLRAPRPVAPRNAQLPLSLGEMAVTLENVALLFGLPCSARFAGVVRRPGMPEVPDFTNSHDPSCAWLRKYNVERHLGPKWILVY
jgi:hypothetical protein